MEATRNPDYLAATKRAVVEFQEALLRFLDLHTVNEDVARGMAPAVFPLEGSDPAEIKKAASAVDIAAGRASAAPGLTNCTINVQGVGVVDPIAAWRSITQPKPVLEPDDILSSCGQILGRLEHMALKAEAEAPPRVGAETMHPLVWGAAQRLWRDGHFREAVAAASESLVTQVKSRTGRNDVSGTSLWQETFSDKGPLPGKPRLRWPGQPRDRDVRSMNDGLRQFAPGVQMTVRNGAVHATAEFGEQEALERLAVLSLLARWVDECELLEQTG